MNCRSYARYDHMRKRGVYNPPKDNYVNNKTRNFMGMENTIILIHCLITTLSVINAITLATMLVATKYF